MNPKTLKSVYKQINKEQLKSEKIELALIDDLKSELQALLSKGNNIKSDLSAITSSMQTGKSVADKLIIKAKRAEDMANDLGIESRDISFIIKESTNYASILDQFSKLIARNLGGL